MTSHASFGGAHHAHFLGGDSEVFAAQSSSDSGWWYDDWSGPSFHSEPSSTPADDPDVGELQPAELEDEQIREAVQSEKMAEALAAEAKLTWQKAQRATAAARRDRGFGNVLGKGASSTGSKGKAGGCFICGSPQHFSRDCPDKHHPSKGFGKSPGKFGMVMDPYDPDYDHYMFSKGAPKGY